MSIYFSLGSGNCNGNDFLIPPFSCQTVLENVIEHNRPKEGEKIRIHISQEADYLKIVNDKGRESRKRVKGGMAIKNLQSQFELLDTHPVLVEKDEDYFTIKIPLIPK